MVFLLHHFLWNYCQKRILLGQKEAFAVPLIIVKSLPQHTARKWRCFAAGILQNANWWLFGWRGVIFIIYASITDVEEWMKWSLFIFQWTCRSFNWTGFGWMQIWYRGTFTWLERKTFNLISVIGSRREVFAWISFSYLTRCLKLLE